MTYRKEIDGLRAIAVLAGVFFHAGFSIFEGGYVGVDIFFVISGYLITTLIIKEKEQGSFSVVRFYEKRIRRILPILFVSLIACLPLALMWLLPSQLATFGKALISVVLYLSNYFFASELGYFSAAAGQQPLIHIWSLSFEEQFYLFFPLLIVLCWRFGRQHLIKILLAIAGLSFLWASWLVFNQNFAGYFSTVGRLWEILLGSLISLYSLDKKPQFSFNLKQAGSLIGLIFILLAVFTFKRKAPNPSYLTLLPTLGTALVILFATSETWVNKILSHKIMVTIGLVSYSFYLWHQPFFAFARVRFLNVGTLEMIALTLLAFILSLFSWKYIEQPFRDRKKTSTFLTLFLVSATAALLLSAGWTFISQKGFVDRFPESEKFLRRSLDEYTEYQRNRFKQLGSKFSFSENDQKKLLIIGDSFARDFTNIIFEAGAFQNYEKISVFISKRCQIYKGKNCAGERLERLPDLTKSADVIIFSSQWTPWSAEHLNESISSLPKKAKAKVFVIGAKEFGSYDQAVYFSGADKMKLDHKLPDEILEINQYLKNNLKAAQFVDIISLICGEEAKTCPTFAENEDTLITFDEIHMTKEGATFLGSKIFQQEPLKQFK